MGQLAPVPPTAADLDAGWFSQALGRGEALAVSLRPIGLGNVSDTVHAQIHWDRSDTEPRSVVVKLAAAEPNKRTAAAHWRAYEVEANFYRQLARGLGADVPACYWAGTDPVSGAYAVVLEDLSALRAGDDLRGADADEADRVLAEIASVHAARWDDPALAELDWLNRYPRGQAGMLGAEMAAAAERIEARYVEDLPSEARTVIRRFARLSDRYDRKGYGGPRTISHGDLRNDNVMFSADRVCLVDWQTVQLGSALADVAYYLGSGLPTEVRRAHEAELVRAYHQRLVVADVELDWDSCWREYRRHGLCLLTSMLKAVAQREIEGRAREVIMTMTRRAVAQAEDLDSLDVLLA